MPATRPRASFEPISPSFDLKSLVESTSSFQYVDRISVHMLDQQGLANFEKLVYYHVIVGGKPLVVDGFEQRLDPWTFTTKWLRDNCGADVMVARDLTAKEDLPLTMKHYLEFMSPLTNQFFEAPGAYKEKRRQRAYLKDIDCPQVWQDKLKEHIPLNVYYLNESTGDQGGPGAIPENNIPGRRLGKGIAKAGDLMSSLPVEMRADNLMCYIGHEGTYTPAHREMCASLGQNIMVEASGTVDDDGKPEKPGSSIWFMTESKDRQLVSEYWLSVLGHDIEVENHFAQVVAWKKAPFRVYVVEQRPGDLILIPPLAPHQVWNRGTRTMKVAWNRTTVETLEMALNEALPRSRIVCRDEQYKNKAIVYFTLQKYHRLLQLAIEQASSMPPNAAHQHLYTGKVKQLQKDFKRLFKLYRQILLSEMFSPEERDNPKSIEYLPFDGNVTCAYCRCNIFNRFMTCQSCKDLLGHNSDTSEGDPYDVCMECYAMGRSCGCISNLKWVEQFRWKELASHYETWRQLVISIEGNQVTDKTPITLIEEHQRHGKRTLAEVCKNQLKKRPWKDIHKTAEQANDSEEEEDEEMIIGEDGHVKKVAKKKSKTWLKNNSPCHVCCKRHPNWRMANCKSCDRWWCYGSLFRGWDKMPIEIMEDTEWNCPHCLSICFAGNCRREGKMKPYEPKGTLLGHDTRKVADARSVEVLVDFSVSNLNWLKDDANAASRAQSSRMKRARVEAEEARDNTDLHASDDENAGNGVDESRVEMELIPNDTPIDPALEGGDSEETLARRLQQADASFASTPRTQLTGAAPEGYMPIPADDFNPPVAQMHDTNDGISSWYAGEKRPHEMDKDEAEDISMAKQARVKRPRMSAAGFRSSDLADLGSTSSRLKNEAQRQFEKEKERKAIEKAKAEGRFIILQAALKGKKRIVKMRLSRPNLESIATRESANAAPVVNQDMTGGSANNPNSSQNTVTASLPASLLKSDILQKKSVAPAVPRITSITKKARIPVERDTSYGSYTKETRRPDMPNGKRQRSTVDYEEVDIGSDEEDGDSLLVSSTVQRVNPRERRARHDDEPGMSYPEALPNDYRDRGDRRDLGRSVRNASPHETHKDRNGVSEPSITRQTVLSKRHIGRPAGKRPSMRPAALADRTNGEIEDVDRDDDFANTNQLAQSSFTANSRSSPTSSDSPINESASAGISTAKQREIDEDNRLAKLQALNMVQGNLSDNETSAREDDEDDEDDGDDSIPARALVKSMV